MAKACVNLGTEIEEMYKNTPKKGDTNPLECVRNPNASDMSDAKARTTDETTLAASFRYFFGDFRRHVRIIIEIEISKCRFKLRYSIKYNLNQFPVWKSKFEPISSVEKQILF